jgi:hypothetical protein
MEISARLRRITASWFGDQYGPSWKVNLDSQPQTSDLGNEIYATVLRADDESWNEICRILGLPSCAAQISTTIGATKEEEANIMIRYAWAAGWPVRGTIALTMDEGTESAFEFSVRYELLKEEEEPTWDNLWESMAQAIIADGIILPANVSRVRLDYLMGCETTNQSARILWRKKASRIPEDHGLQVFTVYGVRGVIRTLYNGTMEVIQLPGQKWSYTPPQDIRVWQAVTLPTLHRVSRYPPRAGSRARREGPPTAGSCAIVQ